MAFIDVEPSGWRELEEKVARILRECGMDVASPHRVVLARGEVEVDVFAVDSAAVPPITVVCECKHWQTSVPQQVVHAFRSVMADCGANIGLMISAAGFQAGASAAAELTNIRLLTWEEFQTLYASRWFQHHMMSALSEAVPPLVEYTEPFNSRITRKARALPDNQQEQFHTLRQQWGTTALLAAIWAFRTADNEYPLPDLPLRRSLNNRAGGNPILATVLDATTLRELLQALLTAYQQGIQDFDTLFGGRA